MVIERGCVAVCGVVALSDTFAVKFVVPAAAGVPVMAPLEAVSVRFAGSDPTLIDQVYGGVPPLAVSVSLYAVPAVPPGNGEVVVIVNTAGTIVPL
jgi:hypothetical protein